MAKRKINLAERKNRQKQSRSKQNVFNTKSRVLVKNMAMILIANHQLLKEPYERASMFNDYLLMQSINDNARNAVEDFTGLILKEIIEKYINIYKGDVL